MKQLTSRQHEILEYISLYHDKKGYSPTLRDIRNHFSISLGTAAKFIRILKEKGAITISEKKWRGIRLAQDDEKLDVRKIPIIGQLTQGEKIELFIQPKQINFPSYLLPENGTYYGFISKTDSFSKKGILKDDLVIIETTQEAEDNTLLLITKNEAVFLGHLIKEKATVIIDDTQIGIDEAVIRGRVVWLLRSYLAQLKQSSVC